jgi:hypothetical protein
MSKEPEVRYFPIPKNLKEMNSEELNEYATKLADHLLHQAQEEKEALENSRYKRAAFKTLRIIALLLAAFFFLVSLLQFQDDFIGYGFVSIGLGSLFLALTCVSKLVHLVKKGFRNK